MSFFKVLYFDRMDCLFLAAKGIFLLIREINSFRVCTKANMVSVTNLGFVSGWKLLNAKHSFNNSPVRQLMSFFIVLLLAITCDLIW